MKKLTGKGVNMRWIVPLMLITATFAVTGMGHNAPLKPVIDSEQSQSNISLMTESESSDILQTAYGGGTAVEFERRSTFRFNAVRQADGDVTGTIVYMFRDFDLDFYVHVNVDCLTIDGNRAKLSGLITQISANFPLPSWALGARASMQVEDNGNGNGSVPDRYSDFHFFQATCADDNEPYIPIDGNIVVSH